MPEYRVYVVELSPDAASRREHVEAPAGPVYVGQTAHPVAKRFAQHKAGGYLSAGVVRRYGVRPRPDLSEHVAPLRSREEAEAAEQQLAEELERAGYAVFWG